MVRPGLIAAIACAALVAGSFGQSSTTSVAPPIPTGALLEGIAPPAPTARRSRK